MLYEVQQCVSTVGCGAEGHQFVQMIGTVTQVSCVPTFKCTEALFVFDLLTTHVQSALMPSLFRKCMPLETL